MPLIVRLATPSDASAIAAVQLATWRATYREWIPEVVASLDLARTAANWEQAARTVGQRVVVAERDGQIVGYAHSGPPDGDVGDAAEHELYALYVRPDAQGAGVGRRLVADVLAAAPGEWVVWSLERYEPARRFYERLGFRIDPGHTRSWRGLTEVRYRRGEKSLDDPPTGPAVMAAWQTLGPLMDLVTPMALRVAATLRLADFMPDDGAEEGAGESAGEGAALADLAERAGADPEALARMLRHLVQHGVFTEPRPGRFAVNQTAALLRTGQPAAVWLDLNGFGGRMDLAFTDLMHTVRTGAPAWEQVFGQPFWAYLDANPAFGASFDATMAVGAGNTPVATGYDWAAVRHVADIGGGTGTLIAEVLRHNPSLRGTLVDLPETAARARQYLAGQRLDGRCAVVGQSFFEPLPAGADAYLLNRVIHDWDDAAASAILRRCREAANRTGRVLMVESHGIAGADPAAFAEMNLRMLVLTGGRERTIDDYSTLAAGAGLRVTAVHDISERQVIIECVPA
jgi:2,7-dihydroxy-5-methyl-1-naphthoate 7-O-methyltransferase